MSKTIIIDYGAGNLKSTQNAFLRCARDAGEQHDIIVSSAIEDVKTADRIVLPGVGAYADCMAGLQAVDGMVETLHQRVISQAVPFLGVCVGMQLLASEGREKIYTKGLDWIPGVVKHIEPQDPGLKIPHMGWNQLIMENPHPIFDGIELGEDGLHAYFVHSYHFEVADPAHLLASVNYGQKLTAMVGHNNIVATQFHPEKSQKLGLQLISNFLKWTP